jgi:hypothetical protein
VSRFAVLLVGSALMLIIAACDMNDDDNDIDGTADDTTELPINDGDADDTDIVVPEDDDAVTPDDDEAIDPADDDAIDSAGDEAVGTDDEEALDQDAIEPGPEQGMFFDLSFDEAQDLSPFEVREPGDVPEGVELQAIIGMASPEADEDERSEVATWITFSYVQAPTDEMQQGLPVELTQTTEMDMSEGLPPEAERDEIMIGDREVTRVQIAAETGDQIIAYMWQDGDVYFSLAAILGPDLEESELEDMVASVPSS